MCYYNVLNKDLFIYSDEYHYNLRRLMHQLDTDSIRLNLLNDNFLFNKLVSLCTKKGNSKMAYTQVIDAFKLIKESFRISPSFFLKRSVLQLQTFIYLHQIPRGKKIRYFPRILPAKTRVFNALYIIVKEAFDKNISYKFFYESLANSIIENSMPDNKYRNETIEIIKKAADNKRSIKRTKKKGVKVIIKIKRRERFKLFRKVKVCNVL